MRYQYIPTRIAKIKTKIKTVKILNDGKDAEKPDLSYIACGNVKCCSNSEEQLAVFYKTKHATISPSNFTLEHLSQINENLRSHKTLHTNILSIIAPNWKQPKCPKMSE